MQKHNRQLIKKETLTKVSSCGLLANFIEKETPLQVLSCEFLQFFSEQPFCKTSAFVCKPKTDAKTVCS